MSRFKRMATYVESCKMFLSSIDCEIVRSAENDQILRDIGHLENMLESLQSEVYAQTLMEELREDDWVDLDEVDWGDDEDLELEECDGDSK